MSLSRVRLLATDVAASIFKAPHVFLMSSKVWEPRAYTKLEARACGSL